MHAELPLERIRMPMSLPVCDSMRYLQTEGLPPRLAWDYPPRSRYAERHLVDFGTLANPATVRTLLGEAIPGWYLLSRDWNICLAIGTWSKHGRTGSAVEWVVCVDIATGNVLRVEIDPVRIDIALRSQQELAQETEECVPSAQRIAQARSECIVLVNSTAQQMMECVERYLSFVNGALVTAEEFLDAVGRIDSPANASGGVWHSLVSDYLRQEEY